MSAWKFFGSWFPGCETIETVTGNGTIKSAKTWTKSEMVEFEWKTKSVRLQASGTLAYHYVDPFGINPDQTITVNWSIDVADTPVAGTTWNVLEPNDFTDGTGGRAFSPTGTDVQPAPFTDAGIDQLAVSAQTDINGLGALDGTDFATYVKSVSVRVVGFAKFAGAPFPPGQTRTSDWLSGASPGGEVGTFDFFGTATGYGSPDATADDSFYTLIIDDLTLSVSESFTQPPDL